MLHPQMLERGCQHLAVPSTAQDILRLPAYHSFRFINTRRVRRALVAEPALPEGDGEACILPLSYFVRHSS